MNQLQPESIMVYMRENIISNDYNILASLSVSAIIIIINCQRKLFTRLYYDTKIALFIITSLIYVYFFICFSLKDNRKKYYIVLNPIRSLTDVC